MMTQQVVASDHKARSESVTVSLQAAEGAVHQWAGLALAPIEMCLAGFQLAGVRPHEPGEEWIDAVSDKKGQNHHFAQLEVWHPGMKCLLSQVALMVNVPWWSMTACSMM